MPDDVRKILETVYWHEPENKEPEKPAFKVYRGEICYLSKESDQSFGMWCPVAFSSNHGYPEGMEFYALSPEEDK